MKIQYKILLVIFCVSLFIVVGCAKKEIPPEKYCEKDEDCLTSCGSPEGHGECFNKDYVKSFNLTGLINKPINSPIDGACCACPTSEGVVQCLCQNNICSGK